MKDIFQKYLGSELIKVGLMYFYHKKDYKSLVNIYLQFDIMAWINILCTDESVDVKEYDKVQDISTLDDFDYKISFNDFDYNSLQKNRFSGVRLLTDELNIARGIVLLFENDCNIVIYNKGYEYDDEMVFYINYDFSGLGYKANKLTLSI